MTTLIFLLIPVVIITAYALFMWLRHRKPTSLHSGIDDFKREMDALSPERSRSVQRGRRHDQRGPGAS